MQKRAKLSPYTLIDVIRKLFSPSGKYSLYSLANPRVYTSSWTGSTGLGFLLSPYIYFHLQDAAEKHSFLVAIQDE